MQINFLTVLGLSLTLGRGLGMVVSSINNATTGCAHFALKSPYFNSRIIPERNIYAKNDKIPIRAFWGQS